MNETALIELVNAQAGALSMDESIDAGLLARYPELDPEDLTEVTSLFHLATKLKEALVPVAPSASFREKLLGDLLEKEAAIVVVRPPAYRPGMAWLWVAAAGSVVSFLGVIVLLARRFRNVPGQAAHPATTTI